MDWIQALVDWIRRLVGTEPQDNEKLFCLNEKNREDGKCILRLLCDETVEPGIVGLWECVYENAANDWLVLCVNIAQYREKQKQSGSEIKWRRSLELNMRVEMEKQKLINASHVVTIAVRSKEKLQRQVIEGKAQSFHKIDLYKCFAVNLQTNEKASELFLGGNHYAKKVVGYCALRVFLLESELNDWESLVRGIPWLKWLDFYAKRWIAPDHVLQPAKAPRAQSRRL